MRVTDKCNVSRIVPCGKCNFCLQNRRNAWAFRLHYHLKSATTADFITLTYNNESLPIQVIGTRPYAVLDKEELQRFHKTLKQAQQRELKKLKIKGKEREKWKIKYYSVGEYGTTYNRPHYHSIIFNIHPEVKKKLELNELWTKGTIFFGNVTERSIQYVAKYVIDKEQAEDARPRPFANMSKGLGSNYIQKRGQYHIQSKRMYVMKDGFKQAMPRYYKERIFNETQRKYLSEKARSEAEKAEREQILKIMHEENTDEHTAINIMEERIQQAHEQIRIKSKNLNSKFI